VESFENRVHLTMEQKTQNESSENEMTLKDYSRKLDEIFEFENLANSFKETMKEILEKLEKPAKILDDIILFEMEGKGTNGYVRKGFNKKE